MSTTSFGLSYAALWILVVFQGLLLLGLVRVVHQLQASVATVEGPGLLSGKEAPAFSTVDVFGSPVDSNRLRDRLTAVLFVSPSCPSCTVTLEELDALATKTSGNVIVVCKAGQEECRRLAERYGLAAPVVADERAELSDLFGVETVPVAVLINEHNLVQSYGHPMRPADLEGLLATGAREASGNGEAP
jgi:peroxiredoxin